QSYDVSWVEIDEPHRAHSPGEHDDLGVYSQGKAKGASTFARLEGCWWGNGGAYLVSTSGGDAKQGQVWFYDPKQERLTLVYESPSADVLDSPDNICVSPRGGIVLCEDGDYPTQRLHGLTLDGRLFQLAANNIDLTKKSRGSLRGDYRSQEWCGATFSPDGKWLFANVQTPG